MRVVIVAPLPNLRMAVQRGRNELLPPTSGAGTGELRFDFPLRLGPPLPDGRPNFLGEFAHGTRAERFVYVNAGKAAGQAGSPWERRAKLMRTGVTPAQRVHDLGGFEVRRAVPSLQARSVGPFVFVDQMGPAVFEPGRGIDVRPHPHIGLATVTFLWAGTIHHRDTLGSAQDISPGDVNWMTAGRGIAHSERSPQALRAHQQPLHGMQTWVALPKAHEETAPAFHHHPAATLPQRDHAGARIRVIAGRGFGMESPVRVFADTFNVALDLQPGSELALDDSAAERALYVLEGEAQLDGADIPDKHLILLDRGSAPRLRAKTPVKAMLLGGEPLDGARHLWWNFVSSSRERIEQAKQDWLEGRFGLVPGDSEEFIPLPQK